MKNNNFFTSSYIVVSILLVAVAVIAMSTFINRPTPIQNTILLIEPVVLKQGHYQPITEYIVSGKPYNIRLSANKQGYLSLWQVNMTGVVKKIFPIGSTGKVKANASLLVTKDDLIAGELSGSMRLFTTWTKKLKDQPNANELQEFELQSEKKQQSIATAEHLLMVYNTKDNIPPPIASKGTWTSKSGSGSGLRLTGYTGNVFVLALSANTNGLQQTNSDARKFANSMSRLFIPANRFQQIVVANQVNRTRFIKEINNLARKVSPNDTIVMYFSGHSENLGGGKEAFRLANNTKVVDWEFRNMIKRLKTRNIIVFLDTCLASGYTKNSARFDVYGRRLKGSYRPILTANKTDNKSPELSIISKNVLVAASAEGEYAREDIKHGGVFTNYILNALENNQNIGKPFLAIIQQALAHINREHPGKAGLHLNFIGNDTLNRISLVRN